MLQPLGTGQYYRPYGFGIRCRVVQKRPPMPVYYVRVSEILLDFLKDKMLYGTVPDTQYERSVYIFFSENAVPCLTPSMRDRYTFFSVLRIRDPEWKNSDPGSEINIPDPQH
jgi:hypothetical protein